MRNNKRLVYGSSYDRGLEHLLKMWPEIKAEVPEAELHVFYGWDLFDKGYADNPAMQEWKEKINKLMEQDDITHLGRISHEGVRKEFESAGIWAYPTHFGEISCITAMKAQAFGAVPVVVSYAALAETVQHGIKVDGDIYDQETKDEFKRELVSLLKDETRQEQIRKPMMEWAQSKFKWENVAGQWSNEFKSKESLEKQVEALMEDNQTLKAWDLVKDTSSPLKERVWLRVKHAFDPEAYRKYYEEDLTEYPLNEDDVVEAQRLYPRFAWVVPKILELKPKSMVDLGCADGALPLTLARHGIKSVGVNLYKPSVELANKRAKRLDYPATFVHSDIFDYKEKHDVVVMMEVIEHLPDPVKGIKHALSLLNDGGHLFISTPRHDHLGVELHKNDPNRESWDDGKPSGHLRLFTEEEFRALLHGYEIVEFVVDAERCMLVQIKK